MQGQVIRGGDQWQGMDAWYKTGVVYSAGVRGGGWRQGSEIKVRGGVRSWD